AAAGQMGVGTTAGSAGQLVSVSGKINGVTESAAYTYDVDQRLVTSSQTSNGVTAGRSFTWDRWGNRTSETDTIANTRLQAVTLQQSGGAPTNQIASIATLGGNETYTYDAAGNVTSDGSGNSYTYDAENRLVSVAGLASAQYGYDPANKRIKKVAGGSTTHCIWDRGSALAEHDGATGNNLVDYILYSSGRVAKVTSSGTVYVLSDWLSERLQVDASGNILGTMGTLPFGEDFAESGSQEKHHFTSYERDAETGLDYANRRVYSSGSGRFQSVDTYGRSGAATNPQTLNRYAYVMGDPVNSADPSGMWQIDKQDLMNNPNYTGDGIGDSCQPVGEASDGTINTSDCIDDTGTGGGDGSDPRDAQCDSAGLLDILEGLLESDNSVINSMLLAVPEHIAVIGARAGDPHGDDLRNTLADLAATIWGNHGDTFDDLTNEVSSALADLGAFLNKHRFDGDPAEKRNYKDLYDITSQATKVEFTINGIFTKLDGCKSKLTEAQSNRLITYQQRWGSLEPTGLKILTSFHPPGQIT
ncbi:MAG TPA: RHS repeat-associated core domain-containing protein, partial [Blastocatellia bacterium]|nr:RHS repeat-associated core domain-containing protein [Blastocatellia bacterium]